MTKSYAELAGDLIKSIEPVDRIRPRGRARDADFKNDTCDGGPHDTDNDGTDCQQDYRDN